MAELNELPVLSMDGWPAGVVNRPSELDQPDGSARILDNVDLFQQGNVRRRSGLVKQADWKGGHSAWTDSHGRGFYITTTDAIQVIVNGEDIRTVGPQVNSSRLMSWAEFDNRIYYSNGIDRGYIDGYADKPWGIDNPPPPRVTAPALGADQVLVAQTAIYNGGEESGASLIVPAAKTTGITVPTGGGADAFDVYVSAVNGTELYYFQTVQPGGTIAYEELARLGRPLMLRVDKCRMPAGQIIERFHRRLLSAQGRLLYWSEVEQASLCDMRHNWYLFDHPITALIPMEDGCYLGLGDKLVWAQGADPEDWVFTQRVSSGIIPQVNTRYFEDDLLPAEGAPGGPLSMCWTVDGECYSLRNNGYASPVAPLYTVAPYQQAVYGYREIDGLRQILTAFTGVQGPALGRYRS